VDAAIGALDDAIEAQGLRDRTMVIVVADHGEGFGEHGTKYHTMNVYEELIRVPLFISGPGIKPRRVTAPTTLVDLGPTLLDLYGVPTPSRFLGQSLVPFLRGENPKLTRPIAAERQGTRTLVLGDTKVIVDSSRGREEIYDLAADPEEAVNLADSLGAEGQNLLALVELFFNTHQSPSYRPVP
jgi:arylsulfatase A-like enzyme